jgi:hypothetical protein
VLYDTSLPPESPISLGQLISNPRNPTERIQASRLPIHPQTGIHSDTEREVEFEIKSTRGFDIGFSATVLSKLPFEIGGKRKTTITHRYKIKEVEIQTFYPSRAFIRQSVLEAQVLQYLAAHGYRKSIYMVVGIKIAHGAHVFHGRTKEIGGTLGGTVPGAAVGIPLDLGSHIRGEVGKHRKETKEVVSSFVFAYRLREIRYFKKDGTITDVNFTKGAQLHSLYSTLELVVGEKEVKYCGCMDEIDVEEMASEDYEDDDVDSNGCVMVTAERTI